MLHIRFLNFTAPEMFCSGAKANAYICFKHNTDSYIPQATFAFPSSFRCASSMASEI